jgi:hypothetical protein
MSYALGDVTWLVRDLHDYEEVAVRLASNRYFLHFTHAQKIQKFLASAYQLVTCSPEPISE